MKPKTTVSLLAALTLAVVLTAVALHRQAAPPSAPAASTQARPRTFEVQGIIRQVDAASSVVRIQHEEIPGYMPSMTMPFPVKDAAELAGLATGEHVKFRLVVTEDDSWVDHIRRLDNGQLIQVASKADEPQTDSDREIDRVQAGERMPDFSLVDENGHPIKLSDFRGQAVVLTFVYTRCPLPNFCPLMSHNFASLQERLSKEFAGRFHLISVTMDPEFDMPAIMKAYGIRFHADESCWSLATGTQQQVDTVATLLGLFKQRQNGLIVHDLRTALIGPDGKLVHLWKSNAWTPYEVQRRVRETLTGKRDFAAQ